MLVCVSAGIRTGLALSHGEWCGFTEQHSTTVEQLLLVLHERNRSYFTTPVMVVEPGMLFCH